MEILLGLILLTLIYIAIRLKKIEGNTFCVAIVLRPAVDQCLDGTTGDSIQGITIVKIGFTFCRITGITLKVFVKLNIVKGVLFGRIDLPIDKEGRIVMVSHG